METVVVVKAAGIGIGGAGVIGATGYGAYKLITPTNIREKLEWKGKTILDTSTTGENKDQDTWNSLINSYPGTGDSQKQLSSLTSFTTGADNNKKIQELKDACEKELKIKLTNTADDDAKLKAAEAWCTKPSS